MLDITADKLTLDQRYCKGTLRYTKASLMVLFFYLLWGDFAFQLMETVVPAILPLQLKELGASNAVIGILLSTTPAFFNFFMNPVVSFRSDNLRTAWGRRKPFLMVATPFVALFLVLLPFAPEIGGRLNGTFLLNWLNLAPHTVMIAALGLALIFFQVANFCMLPIYYYLVVDVVPDAFMARFQALFRVVAALSAYLFNTFLYGHAMTHAKPIFIGCAMFYLIGFLWMCLKVKEGDYPPPVHDKRLGLIGAASVYARECYSHRHYLLFYARNAVGSFSAVMSVYVVFVLRDEVGLSLDFIGKINGWSALISAALLYPLGALADRYGPVRIALIGTILLVPLPLLNFLFLHDARSATILMLVGLPIATMLAASDLPLYALIPPRERYGQFGSANQLVCALTTMLAAVMAGCFMDVVTQRGTIVGNYRILYLWNFAVLMVQAVLMYLLYRSWLRYGGPSNYRPPAVGNTTAPSLCSPSICQAGTD